MNITECNDGSGRDRGWFSEGAKIVLLGRERAEMTLTNFSAKSEPSCGRSEKRENFEAYFAATFAATFAAYYAASFEDVGKWV